MSAMVTHDRAIANPVTGSRDSCLTDAAHPNVVVPADADPGTCVATRAPEIPGQARERVAPLRWQHRPGGRAEQVADDGDGAHPVEQGVVRDEQHVAASGGVQEHEPPRRSRLGKFPRPAALRAARTDPRRPGGSPARRGWSRLSPRSPDVTDEPLAEDRLTWQAGSDRRAERIQIKRPVQFGQQFPRACRLAAALADAGHSAHQTLAYFCSPSSPNSETWPIVT